ncbi:phenylacetate--CoA ligase family protein [Algicella marina]|uniref:AMP-binding protein n=1 Tax=Algicella marina TaxID=2683284 RepID=A0A6P1T6B1_9RHOB|nr:phenylacetate--CoA ligase [Algicella marina]QHQ36112.1 AMP-binding protein [Algicella marina]
MTSFFDALEKRSTDQREADLFAGFRELMDFALEHAPGLAAHLDGCSADEIEDRAALARLPVLRKSALSTVQSPEQPLGGFSTRSHRQMRHLFMSPGPIFEPGGEAPDFWRLGRFLHASGIGAGDIIQNCFSYHLTPAGTMFESAAAAVGAAVVPAGVGQTEMQARAAVALGVTAYAGTPDFLGKILEKADELGLETAISTATVSGGALFPSLRQGYADRGIATRQCYATADLGLVAYESDALDGMILDEHVIVEIVRPGTGDPVPDGEVGEVLVTVLNRDYPLVRFATGDLSAMLPGESACGRTAPRIKGWMGRADQATKIRGMFVRPEQVAELVARTGVGKARVTISRAGEDDVMAVSVEGSDGDTSALEETVRDLLKVRGSVTIVPPGSLPNDGKVIDDQRVYD